jgi:Mg-chelatase subunit ChlD
MKTEDGNEGLHPWIEPELEARLTALVLGEASDFERDELERLVADRPELGLYRKRLEAMHRMLREVATGESTEEQGEWKLGAERRTAVLARLRGEANAEEKVVVMPRSKRRLPWGMVIRIAACVAVIALLLGLMFPATTGALRRAERPNDGGNAFAYFDSGETSASQHWYFREESRNSSAPQPAPTGGAVVTDPGPDRFVGAISGAGAIAADEFGNNSTLRREPVPTETPATPQLALREEKQEELTDLAIRTPVTATGTTAPVAEPLAVNRSGQTSVANGTVALGSGSLTINGGTEGHTVAGRRVEGESGRFGLEGANTYTGGAAITSGGVLAITSPEPAAAPPASAAPADVSKGYALADTMTRGTTATTDGDGDGLERLGLADSRAGEKAKTQLGQELVEEERMRSLEPLSETTGTLAGVDVPVGVVRDLAAKEVAELAQVDALKAMPESDEKPVMAREKFKLDVSKSDLTVGETPRKAGQADDFGTVTVGQTGAAAAPAPASPAKPMPVAAATASGPAEASEPMVEQPLAKVGAGTLALDSGVTEFNGFVNVEGKKEAASNLPASGGGNLNYTGDTQVNADVDAKGNVAMNAWADTAGVTVDRKNVDAYDFVTPVETDRLSPADKEVAKEAGDAPLRGVVVEKSMEESLVRGGDLADADRTRDQVIRRELPATVSGTTSPAGTVNFGVGVSSIENLPGFFEVTDTSSSMDPETAERLKNMRYVEDGVSQIEKREEFQKTGDANVALPVLQSDKKTFRFSVRAGVERNAEIPLSEIRFMGRTLDLGSEGRAGGVEKSVADIMALTPQVGTAVDPEHLLRQVAPRIVGGRSVPANPNQDALASADGSGLRGFDYRDIAAKESGEDTAVMLDYAAPLDESKLTSEGRFQFTMGASFGDDVVPTAEKPITPQALRQPTPAALDETSPSAELFSTFSLHVSDVSFQLAKSSLASGKWPEAEKIRIEEFVNAFDYGDPVPSMGERVSCRIDQGAHPFLQQRNLVRIALRTAEAGRSSGTPLRLTLLLDSSGSMERPDRRATLTRAVATLVCLLGENDRITLVSFARQPRLVADAVAGNEAMKLAETVASLPSEGGTNLEAALELAFEKAREHQEANAQNRIVLLTDGAANLGDAKAESLGQRVEMMREAGIAFDAAGFGAEGLNDEILEALTRKGDGRYYLLDRPEDAGEAFAEQIAGALRPAAKNVKVQVEFNPNRVKSYKLLGFEKHRLATEDFRNDAVDAAEMAAAEAGVAVYQVEPIPGGEGDLGSVSVRFRDLDSGEMIERRWALPHLASAPAADQGGGATHLAIVASQFAAKLAGGPLGDVVDLGELARLAATLPDSPRVDELRTMIEQARGLEGPSTSF